MKLYLSYSSGFSTGQCCWSAYIPSNSRGSLSVRWFDGQSNTIENKRWSHGFVLEELNDIKDKILTLSDDLKTEVVMDGCAQKSIKIVSEGQEKVVTFSDHHYGTEDAFTYEEECFLNVWGKLLPKIKPSVFSMGVPENKMKYC